MLRVSRACGPCFDGVFSPEACRDMGSGYVYPTTYAHMYVYIYLHGCMLRGGKLVYGFRVRDLEVQGLEVYSFGDLVS